MQQDAEIQYSQRYVVANAIMVAVAALEMMDIVIVTLSKSLIVLFH
jgi:hypothetical protein